MEEVLSKWNQSEIFQKSKIYFSLDKIGECVEINKY